MHTLFISDLHLDNSRPEITDLFIKFLQNEASHSDALYILGDLFETFIGDDEKTVLQQEVSHVLSHLNKKGIPVYLMHGNRDFLIGKKFARQSQIKIISDPTIINLYGKRTLLMHGDTLCTQDIDYLAFRKKARNFILQKIFLIQSLKTRQLLAEKARSISQQHNEKSELSILDATPEEIPHIMKKYQVHQFIHGHTHRPSLHYFWLNGELFFRIVLSDWEDSGHFLIYYDNGLCRLKQWTVSK